MSFPGLLQSITMKEDRQMLSINSFNFSLDNFLNKNLSGMYGFVKATRRMFLHKIRHLEKKKYELIYTVIFMTGKVYLIYCLIFITYMKGDVL